MKRLETVNKQLLPTHWVLKYVEPFPFESVGTLKDKVILISGASRGIGLAIALRAAKDGAKIAIVAKTTEP